MIQLPRPNKNPVYVTKEFKKTTIKTIKQVLRSNQITRHYDYNKFQSVTFNVPKTDISVIFYNVNNGKTGVGDLYIGSDTIQYTDEQAQALYDAFQERWSEQSMENTAEKEAELTAKLQQYIGNTK